MAGPTDPATLRNLIADPRFKQLSISDQRGVLGQMDARFHGISDAELPQVLNMIGGSQQSQSPTDMANQALAASGIQGGAAAPAKPAIQMQESMAPKIVRGIGTALPVVGGMAGGILGAGAGGVGAIGGAAAGGALGQEGNELVGRAMGDQPLSPQESAKRIALAGGLSAAGEGVGGALIGAGGKVLSRVAASQAAKETGSAAAGFAEQTPVAISTKGLRRSFNDAFNAISDRVSTALQGSQGTTSLSQAMAPVTQRAGQSQVTGVATRLNKIITAAKEVAGIQGDQVTADQMFSFGQQLAKPNVYSGNPGPIKAVLDDLLQEGYARAGGAVRSLAPEVDAPLQQLTNIHAARSAIKNYELGNVGSALTTAATHPRTTAALSPLLTAIGAKTGTLKEKAKAVAAELR